jgi:hypothetical protein
MAVEGARYRGAGDRRRPFGVYVIAALQLVNALAHAFGVLSEFEDPLVSSLDGYLSDTLSLLFSLTGIAVAIGLLMLKRGAWIATMLWVGAVMAGEIVLYLQGDSPNYVVMAGSIAQVFYLNLAEVQQAFSENSWSEAPE